MSEIENAAAALMALATGSNGRKKMARLRELLPEIEVAVKAGVTQVKIVEVLNEQGLGVTQNAYSVMLSRLRKQQAKTAESGKLATVVKPAVGKDWGVKPPPPC